MPDIKSSSEAASGEITRSELDQFSANILINLGLINVAGLAAVISIEGFEFSKVPYAIGLIAALLSQLLWYIVSAFDYSFPQTLDAANQKIGMALSVMIVLLGVISATCIVFGCLVFIQLSTIVALLLSIILCFSPLLLLFYCLVREIAYRNTK